MTLLWPCTCRRLSQGVDVVVEVLIPVGEGKGGSGCLFVGIVVVAGGLLSPGRAHMLWALCLWVSGPGCWVTSVVNLISTAPLPSACFLGSCDSGTWRELRSVMHSLCFKLKPTHLIAAGLRLDPRVLVHPPGLSPSYSWSQISRGSLAHHRFQSVSHCLCVCSMQGLSEYLKTQPACFPEPLATSECCCPPVHVLKGSAHLGGEQVT